MSVARMTDLRCQIEKLLEGIGTKLAKEKAITEMVKLYDQFGGNILEKEYLKVYDLYDLTTHIFRMAKKEVEENQEKWENPPDASKRPHVYRTSLFELSIRHLKNCCRHPIDHNTIRWIPYILTILDFKWIQSSKGMESELSNALLLCSMASQLHWAEHSHLKKLWNFIWQRIQDPTIDDNILKDYVEMAVEILKNVDLVVFEKSVFDLVKKVFDTFKKTTNEDHLREWTNKRKYSVVYIISHIVRRWGLETRDFILREIFDLTDYMLSLISVELTTGESKIYMMYLVDDVIKLATIESVKSHRTIDQKTEEKLRCLVKAAINRSLKSAGKHFAMSSTFSISEEYIRFLGRWLLVERQLDPAEPMDESFDSTGSGGKKKERNEFALEGLIHLTFGANCSNKFSAWTGAMEILTELLKTRQLEIHVTEKILSILWEKRKSFQSETLRSTFCHLLSTVIPQNLRFGYHKIPSIDSIFKYALTLMPNVTSLPNAAFLSEEILRYRSPMVPKGGFQAIWDTVSRTSPGSEEVLRLISALISYTEFDENSRFGNDDDVGKWSLRKDVIEWLLADPCANSHPLIYELCQYHPIFCYDTEEVSIDDPLLQNLRLCKLASSSTPFSPKSPKRLLEASIQEIVNYVEDKLKSILTSETTLPIFVLAFEFSKKFPDVLFDFDRVYHKLPDIIEDFEEPEFLKSVCHFTEWPKTFEFPAKFCKSLESTMTYLIKNLNNQLIDLSTWNSESKTIVENLAEIAKKQSKIQEETKKSLPFSGFIKDFILEIAGDPYETTKRFEKFSFLLPYRQILVVRDTVIKTAAKALDENSISPTDFVIFQKLTSSALLRVTPKKLDGYEFDPITVALEAANVAFDEKSLRIYLEQLRGSPFLAQNIARSVLMDGEDTWHLHGKLMKMVMKNEKLLTACIATIPNMIRYLRIYQVQYPTKLKAVQFLNFSMDSINSCRKYLRKPKKYSSLVTPDIVILLFGCEKNAWKRAIFSFWKLFEQEPAIVCERLFEFATESVELGLQHRLVSLLQALTTSEFCRKVILNTHLKMVFELTYRSIFLNLVENECSPTILDYCSDSKLRFDLLHHRINEIPSEQQEDFQRFEEKIAFSVENFLKFGIESEKVDFLDFGLFEFHKQLSENLTEKNIKGNASRNIYIVDILSTIWHQLPSIRPHIRPIIAQFKTISPAWSNFPQPPHLPATDQISFLWKLRLHLTLKVLTANKQWTRGEFATCIMLLLTSYDERHRKEDLIRLREMEKLRTVARRNVLCLLSMILKKETIREAHDDGVMVEEHLFEALTRSAALFPDIASYTVPFLFKICTDFKQKYEFATGKLLSCLKGVKKEDQKVVHCLAECVDSVGLDVLARYERVELDSSPQFGPHWYFVLARLFLKHGYLTHAFAIANILFDRLSSKKRNIMMIDRIGLQDIEKSSEIIELLVEIYVAENNSVALSSLPPGVQNRPDVRHVMNKNSKEWLRLAASNNLDPKESTFVQWMCGLPSTQSGDKYLDSILRFHFEQYPKILNTPLKFVYFCLYHKEIGTEIPLKIQNVVENMLETPTIDEFRLMMIARETANFHPDTVEEHMVRAVRELRKTVYRRKTGQYQHAKHIDYKTRKMVKLAEILTENNVYDAAIVLLNTWEEECIKWKIPSLDLDLIRISKEFVTCQSGDPRTSEINLRTMQPRVNGMSPEAIAEWTLVLSKITIEYRNDLEEGIRILELGLKHLQSKNSYECRLKVLLKFHSVCNGQLSKLEEYLETRSYRMKKEVISEFEIQIQNSTRLQRGNSGDDTAKRSVQRVRKEQQIEKADVEKVENLVVSAARKAVSSAFDALSCINHLEDHDEAIRTSSLIIFPLIDVIYKYERDAGIANLLKEYTKNHLPSKLWLCATSHIASKCFSVEKSPLTKLLAHVLCQLIYDYPYHVMHTVLMYEYEKNGSEVRNFLKFVYAMKSSRSVGRLKEIAEAMREAHAAYREVANLDAKTDKRIKSVEVAGKTELQWPKDLKIFRCKLDILPIPTISQQIGRAGDLTDAPLITWKNFKPTFQIADGLSAPKIWEIQGSDGKWYKTVWKKDDVRQDVLVEQMFDVTNNMLERRMLRTYNVVPLDTECGIIEFCGGTVSLKELLCGVNRNSGLHQEYNPDEESASKVSMMMRQVQTDSTETKRRVFKDICQQYSPVFRHFFYTNFSTCHIWREKIIDYRQSLATWSVVCYIVGLGDRHASNILFDQKMCTFVHIDLGMILEYSKRSLPVPEQVPFRISRDVLDPILIEGIENGQLAEDCTRIMEKLKDNGKVILGVASALLRETMTNFREADQKQQNRPSYISEMAIGRLRDKLRGTDDGVTAQSSNLQVRRLLREATNADNLSRMFCGWMPFL